MVKMAINALLVRSYASNVYMTGTNSLTNIGATRPEYVQPVMQRAADAYYIDYIGDALTRNWITPQEHADTLALKGPEDPQYSEFWVDPEGKPETGSNSIEEPPTETVE